MWMSNSSILLDIVFRILHTHIDLTHVPCRLLLHDYARKTSETEGSQARVLMFPQV